MTQGMRIAFFGASLVSAYENEGATYCRGLLRALAAHGHAIRFYEPLNEERLMHRDILDPSWAQVIRFSPDGEGVEAALDHASDADIIVKFSGIGVFDELLDAAVPRCTASHALSIYWDLQPETTLALLEKNVDHPLRAQLPWYDLVISRYGGNQAIEAFQKYGVRNCFPVYNALDPDIHYPVDSRPEYRTDLLYIAHRQIERDVQVQHNFFDVAATLPSNRFVVGGCGWEDVAMPANVRYAGYVYTAEHNGYYSSATAVLNVTLNASARYGYAPTTRLFEATGARACVISDAWPGMENFFEPGREILIAHDTTEIVDCLENLGTERVMAISRRGYKRSKTEHTYEHRIGELEALLEGLDRQWINRTAL